MFFAINRKTRRPDQQLYVPGALRQARWEQQPFEQKLSKEGAVKREENEIISTDNAAGADALSRSTAEEFSDKCFGQECDSKVDESKNVVDGTQGSGNIQDQQRNINCTSVRGISSGSLGRDDINQIDGKELKNEEVTTIIARDSTMVTCESAPHLTYITANNASGSFDSQFLNTESNGDKFDDINYKGVIDGTGSLQISSTCADRDNGAAENLSADASEDFKMLNNKTCNGTDRMTLHNQCERASNENLVNELNQRQDDPLLKASKGLLVKEKTNHHNGMKSKVPEDGEVKSDNLSEVVAGVDANHDGMAKVGSDEICTVMKSVPYSDVSMTHGSYAVDCNMEKIQNKIIGPESVQQSALLSSATQEYTESNFGTNVLTLCEQMPAAALTDSLQETSGGRTVSKDYYPRDQHITVNRHPQDVSENVNWKFDKTALALSDLTGSYSLRTRTEEVTDKAEVGTSQVDYNSEGKDTVNSANDRDTSTENTNPTCLVEINREVETVSGDFGGRNLDKTSDGLEGNSEEMRENIEASSGKVEDGSDPISVIYVSKTNNEQKPETSKKKKSKKDKSIKEKTDEKTKSKEKGEKKKKKEKKGEKTEKSDKNTEESVNKGKKLKAKVLSDKHDERDLNTCDTDVREELSTSTKAGEKKSQSNASDDGGDDSDNWESFYDESGDCLNPEQLEEVC